MSPNWDKRSHSDCWFREHSAFSGWNPVFSGHLLWTIELPLNGISCLQSWWECLRGMSMNRISKINYVVFSYALLTSVPLDLDLPRSHVLSGPTLERRTGWVPMRRKVKLCLEAVSVPVKINSCSVRWEGSSSSTHSQVTNESPLPVAWCYIGDTLERANIWSSS